MVQGKAPTKKTAPKKQAKTRPVAREKENATVSPDRQFLPRNLQQTLLDIFKDACFDGTIADFEATLQEVKGHLYNRDFATAFGKDSYLQAYAARWSPSRALGYAQVFHDLEDFITGQNHGLSSGESLSGSTTRSGDDVEYTSSSNDADSAADVASEVAKINLERSKDIESEETIPSINSSRTLKLACIGGGAGAEIVGLAGWLKTMEKTISESTAGSNSVQPLNLDVLCLDIAHWDTVVKDLHQHCVAPKVLSKYASAAAIAANVPLLSPESLDVRFQQKDVLDLTPAESGAIYSDMDLVTILFTLNELYTASVAKTQRMLHSLTANLKTGALLLVVDSPGSYSAVTINGAEKKYPMQWLLDHTLLPTPGKKGDTIPEKRWEKLVSDESRWFRIQEALKYSIPLESMRYQVHLYRRCGAKP